MVNGFITELRWLNCASPKGHIIGGTSTATSLHVSPLYIADGRGPSKSMPYALTFESPKASGVDEQVSYWTLFSKDDCQILLEKGQDVGLFLGGKQSGGRTGEFHYWYPGNHFLQGTKTHNKKWMYIHGTDPAKIVLSSGYGNSSQL